MPDRLVTLLKETDRSGEYVCTVPPDRLRETINRICRKNGLPEVGIHGLRHSFASLGYHLGIPAKAMQQAGGWSDDHTMLKIYTHIAQSDDVRHRSALTQFFDSAGPDEQSAGPKAGWPEFRVHFRVHFVPRNRRKFLSDSETAFAVVKPETVARVRKEPETVAVSDSSVWWTRRGSNPRTSRMRTVRSPS